MATTVKPKNILIMCESSGWQWGIGTEFINFELKNGVFYDILDLSFLGEFNLKSRIKLVFGGFRMRKESLEFFKQKDLRIINHFTLRKFQNQQTIEHFPIEQSPAINSIVERCQTIDLELIKTDKKNIKIVESEFRKSNLVYSVLKKIDFSNVEKVVTVNGRFTKSATVVRFCKENAINLELLEGGNKSTSFQVFKVGPHSTQEIQEKINQLWNTAVEPYRSEVSRKYLDNVVLRREIPGIDFRSKIVWDRVPKFSGKKTVAFFAGSEWEYYGVRESVPSEHFQNQIEALMALVEILDKDVWDIYLRRHPVGHNTDQGDGEKSLWTPFQNIPNVFIIDPGSDIDSIALGLSVDLIASYGSTINVEFYARKLINVITLGPAPWNDLLPERYLPTKEKILDFMSSNITMIQEDRLLPWAYYQIESGTEFELISTNEKTGRWKMKRAKPASL
jgi:hypothetical protein